MPPSPLAKNSSSHQLASARVKSLLRRYVPTLIGLAVFVVAVGFLNKQLGAYAFADVMSSLSAIKPWQILVALLFTAINYLVLTGYDWLGMRYIKAALAWHQIALTSFMAFAIGHNVGFAALSGGAIRYRAYASAGLSLPEIAKVIGFCTLGFLLGCSFLLGLLLLTEPGLASRHLPLSNTVVQSLGIVSLCVVLAYLLWSRQPSARARLPGLTLEPPSTRIASAQILLACADLMIASFILWVLLPESATPAYPVFVGFYLIGIVITLISNVPGGLGVFESSLLLLLAPADTPAVLASLLAFRVIFYLCPFTLAMLSLGTQLFLDRRIKAVN